MVPHYGKRNLGAGTAASPGDTLFFNFATYNDSGNSEPLSGFAVGDIEVFKDGSPTPRATDSGYSLISDTGMVGNRAGLYRFRVRLFNTSDDPSFYANGSWYQVAVDSVTIDGKPVRMWVGSFEIGTERANMVQVAGDTGAARHVQQAFASLNTIGGGTDTGLISNVEAIRAKTDNLTFTAAGAVDANMVRLAGDTGSATHLRQAFAVQSTNSDTGLIANAEAIRAKTDDLTFASGSVNANVKQVNNVTVVGTGAPGNRWRPA